jgi:hypothetical protein
MSIPFKSPLPFLHFHRKGETTKFNPIQIQLVYTYSYIYIDTRSFTASSNIHNINLVAI